MLSRFTGLCALAFVLFSVGPVYGQISSAVTNKIIILATTTSTQDSGLLDLLVPLFQKKTGYVVKTIAVGTGLALAMGRRGDVDVLLVHAPLEEKKFIAEGHGISRLPCMYNDFVLVGPASDPARISKTASTEEALRKIAASQSLFLSRGDNSGTHLMEKRLWTKAGSQPIGARYQQTGQGMGQTLVIASEKNGYTLTDRSTYLALKKRLEISILFKGDPELFNIYSLIKVNPQKSPRINSMGGQEFIHFMLSPETLSRIKTFGVEKYGEPLFKLINTKVSR